jgi:hypothetical protein
MRARWGEATRMVSPRPRTGPSSPPRYRHRRETVTPPRPHRRCFCIAAADDPPPPGRVRSVALSRFNFQTAERIHLRTLATHFARVLHRPSPSRAGKAGWPLHPGLPRKRHCASAKTTGTGGDNRPSLRDGLRLISRSPVNQRLPPSLSAMPLELRANLAPAWARQNHTALPSASVPVVLSALQRPPPSAPRS